MNTIGLVLSVYSNGKHYNIFDSVCLEGKTLFFSFPCQVKPHAISVHLGSEARPFGRLRTGPGAARESEESRPWLAVRRHGSRLC